MSYKYRDLEMSDEKLKELHRVIHHLARKLAREEEKELSLRVLSYCLDQKIVTNNVEIFYAGFILEHEMTEMLAESGENIKEFMDKLKSAKIIIVEAGNGLQNPFFQGKKVHES